MEKILIDTRQGKQSGDEIFFLCPAHDDHNPSARYSLTKKVWFCDACKAGGSEKQLQSLLGTQPTTTTWASKLSGSNEVSSYDESTITKNTELLFSPEGKVALNYLGTTRGLPFSSIAEWKLGYDSGRNAISIPIYNDTGVLKGIKYRHLDPAAPSRYSHAKGTRPCLFGFDPRKTQRDTIVLFEGELDAITSQILLPDIQAVAVMGVSNWTDEFTKHVSTFGRIIIAFDPDTAGDTRAISLGNSLGSHRCSRLRIESPDHDLNDLFVRVGREQAAIIYENLIKTATPLGAPLLVSMRDAVPAMLEYFKSGAYKGISTGFTELDALFGGFKSGSITMMMAYPGDGKTTLAAAIAYNMISMHNMPVAVGSFDTFLPTTVLPKIMSFHLKCNVELDLGNNTLSLADYEKSANELMEQDKLHWLLSEETSKPAIDQVCEGIRTAYKKGIRFILIDYLQTMLDETDLSNVKEVMVRLKNLRKELPEIIILLVVQPKRKMGDAPALSMQDMKGGSVIEEVADTILALDGKRYVRTLKIRADAVLCPTESKVPMSFDKKKYAYTFGNVLQSDCEGSTQDDKTPPIDWSTV